jgi:toxin ParE1/3/4
LKIRWTKAALRHLHEAYDYIQMDKPSAARRMADLIEGAADRLRLFPQIGRPSKRPKTHELAVSGTPFVLIYRVKNDSLEIVALYHGARDWQKRL